MEEVEKLLVKTLRCVEEKANAAGRIKEEKMVRGTTVFMTCIDTKEGRKQQNRRSVARKGGVRYGHYLESNWSR